MIRGMALVNDVQVLEAECGRLDMQIERQAQELYMQHRILE